VLVGFVPMPSTHRKGVTRKEPKIKRASEICTPIFMRDNKGKLKMGDNLELEARALDLTNKLS